MYNSDFITGSYTWIHKLNMALSKVALSGLNLDTEWDLGPVLIAKSGPGRSVLPGIITHMHDVCQHFAG